MYTFTETRPIRELVTILPTPLKAYCFDNVSLRQSKGARSLKLVTLQPLGEGVNVKTESRLLESLLASNCEVAMACGGQGICATCHVKVLQGHDSLSPPTSREQRSLSLMTGRCQGSRLACQAKVLGEGVVIELPEGMFIEKADDLTSLVGRRTKIPILHPRDGRVLIRKNKIITLSKITQLEKEDFDVMGVRASSEEV